MSTETERRVRTAAQIATYGGNLGLLPYQIDQAVLIGNSQLDKGESGSRAYAAGRKVVDQIVQKQFRLIA
jgi:hypothetical protein